MTESRGIYEMHGGRGTALYNIWIKMRARCENANDKAFPDYGARGISVCDRWSSFANFRADMGPRPKGMSIERVDNSKGYSPENCVWADRKAQNRNKRSNRLLTIDGETQPISVWAERYGLKYATVHQRLVYGWPPADAVKVPLVSKRAGVPRGKKIYAAFGVEHGVEFGDQQERAA